MIHEYHTIIQAPFRAGGARGEKTKLAGTNQQRAETQNNMDIMYHMHTIN
jgi:hypothetical protein